MPDFDYRPARDLNTAWLNFDPDIPLNPGPLGRANPFYVERPYNAAGELEDTLLAPSYRAPKCFWSGHRGCGKSTELLKLAAKPEIRRRYWPVHFSIREEADINDLDFKDVLLALGGRMYRDYVSAGGELAEQLNRELEQWRGQVVTEVETLAKGRISGLELEIGVPVFLANLAAKLRVEPETRKVLRQVFERNITGLIDTINKIAQAIQAQSGKLPLVLIDDLDKLDLEPAKKIFYERREIMLSPLCATVYTVSSALFYSKELSGIHASLHFLPNINLHLHHAPDERDTEGFETLRTLAYKRLDKSLITPAALDLAITFSGGVFREMARLTRAAIGRARRRRGSLVEELDVSWAAQELQNEYRRVLEPSDLALLRQVHNQRVLQPTDQLRTLLQILAVLEYRNDALWCDIHPVLRALLDE